MRQIAIHFIRRDVVETKRRFSRVIQRQPVSSRGFQKDIGTHNVGLNKRSGAGNRSVNVTLCRKVHHRIRFVLGENTIHSRLIANIRMFKDITIATINVGQ